MKRVLLLISHYCSGSDLLYRSLETHPRIQGFRQGIYDNRLSLVNLVSQPHKEDTSAAIYMDELLLNSSITDKRIYPECRYIFVIRDAKDTLNELVVTKKYTPIHAANYYLMRLRRMYSIAKQQPDSVLLTFDDLESGRGGDIIADYLELDRPITIMPATSLKLDNMIDLKLVEEMSYGYEYWLHNLKKLGLRCITMQREDGLFTSPITE